IFITSFKTIFRAKYFMKILFFFFLSSLAFAQHPWPIDYLSIGHNMQSYQNYSFSPYWHDGLDIRAKEEERVYSSTAGEIVAIVNYVRGNPLYWEVAIKDKDGLVWKYHHIDKKTIPEALKV